MKCRTPGTIYTICINLLSIQDINNLINNIFTVNPVLLISTNLEEIGTNKEKFKIVNDFVNDFRHYHLNR